MDLSGTFGTDSPLIGMVHLAPLPGAPRYDGSRQTIRGEAFADALTLVESGFDGLLVENYGDTPYYPEEVPAHVVAELAATVRELAVATDVPLGVNVLRNDAEAALSIATAAGGSFVRVNVHTGARETDQGRIEGQAHETLRLRDRIDSDVAVLADVAVKHSAPTGEVPVETRVAETIERGLADGIVVSGPSTGEPATPEQLTRVLDTRDDTAPDVPVLVGSGVTPKNVTELLGLADGVIVGTALKEDAKTSNPVAKQRARELVDVVKGGDADERNAADDTTGGDRSGATPEGAANGE